MTLDELILAVAKLQYEWTYFNRNSIVDFDASREITRALAIARGMLEGFKTNGQV